MYRPKAAIQKTKLNLSIARFEQQGELSKIIK
jgi:hypothetical protein